MMVMHMQDYAILFLLGSLVFFLSILPPTVHFLSLPRKSPPKRIEYPSDSLPRITIFVPARDESNLIERKLSQIFNLDYPSEKIEILVIDSASKDKTREISETFLEKHSVNEKWRVISIKSPGKSLAVTKALDLIETDFFVMTDVDSIIDKRSVRSMMEIMIHDEEIGGICGKLSTSDVVQMPDYRKRYNTIRKGESIIDSTPIFEGSLCSFRMSALSNGIISTDVNADDSQLAILCRRNGFRSIMAEEVEFTEYPQFSRFEYKRSLRRAQGLSRTLFMNRDLVTMKNKFGRIFLQNLYFYTLMPWLLILSSTTLIYSALDYINSQSIDVELSILFLLFATFLTISLRILRNLLLGCLILINAHILSLLGKSLDVWKPIRY